MSSYHSSLSPWNVGGKLSPSLTILSSVSLGKSIRSHGYLYSYLYGKYPLHSILHSVSPSHSHSFHSSSSSFRSIPQTDPFPSPSPPNPNSHPHLNSNIPIPDAPNPPLSPSRVVREILFPHIPFWISDFYVSLQSEIHSNKVRKPNDKFHLEMKNQTHLLIEYVHSITSHQIKNIPLSLIYTVVEYVYKQKYPFLLVALLFPFLHHEEWKNKVVPYHHHYENINNHRTHMKSTREPLFLVPKPNVLDSLDVIPSSPRTSYPYGFYVPIRETSPSLTSPTSPQSYIPISPLRIVIQKYLISLYYDRQIHYQKFEELPTNIQNIYNPNSPMSKLSNVHSKETKPYFRIPISFSEILSEFYHLMPHAHSRAEMVHTLIALISEQCGRAIQYHRDQKMKMEKENKMEKANGHSLSALSEANPNSNPNDYYSLTRHSPITIAPLSLSTISSSLRLIPSLLLDYYPLLAIPSSPRIHTTMEWRVSTLRYIDHYNQQCKQFEELITHSPSPPPPFPPFPDGDFLYLKHFYYNFISHWDEKIIKFGKGKGKIKQYKTHTNPIDYNYNRFGDYGPPPPERPTLINGGFPLLISTDKMQSIMFNSVQKAIQRFDNLRNTHLTQTETSSLSPSPSLPAPNPNPNLVSHVNMSNSSLPYRFLFLCDLEILISMLSTFSVPNGPIQRVWPFSAKYQSEMVKMIHQFRSLFESESNVLTLDGTEFIHFRSVLFSHLIFLNSLSPQFHQLYSAFYNISQYKIVRDSPYSRRRESHLVSKKRNPIRHSLSFHWEQFHQSLINYNDNDNSQEPRLPIPLVSDHYLYVVWCYIENYVLQTKDQSVFGNGRERENKKQLERTRKEISLIHKGKENTVKRTEEDKEEEGGDEGEKVEVSPSPSPPPFIWPQIPPPHVISPQFLNKFLRIFFSHRIGLSETFTHIYENIMEILMEKQREINCQQQNDQEFFANHLQFFISLTELYSQIHDNIQTQRTNISFIVTVLHHSLTILSSPTVVDKAKHIVEEDRRRRGITQSAPLWEGDDSDNGKNTNTNALSPPPSPSYFVILQLISTCRYLSSLLLNTLTIPQYWSSLSHSEHLELWENIVKFDFHLGNVITMSEEQREMKERERGQKQRKKQSAMDNGKDEKSKDKKDFDSFVLQKFQLPSVTPPSHSYPNSNESQNDFRFLSSHLSFPPFSSYQTSSSSSSSFSLSSVLYFHPNKDVLLRYSSSHWSSCSHPLVWYYLVHVNKLFIAELFSIQKGGAQEKQLLELWKNITHSEESVHLQWKEWYTI